MTIKRILVALFVQLFLTFCLSAQQNKFVIGIDGGPGIGSLYGKPNLIAATAGGFFQSNFSQLISFCTGLGYDRISDRNSNYTGALGGALVIPATECVQYLTIPAMVRVSFGRKIAFFVNGGIFLSFLLHASETDAGYSIPNFNNGYNNYPSETYPVNYNYTKAEVGVILGLGVSIPIHKNFAFVAEEKNKIGLTNVLTGQVYYYHDATAHTLSLCMLVGFSYSFGKIAGKGGVPQVKK